MLFPECDLYLPASVVYEMLSGKFFFFLPSWSTEILAILLESAHMHHASWKLYVLFIISFPTSEHQSWDHKDSMFIRTLLFGESQNKSNTLNALRSHTLKTTVNFCLAQQFLNLLVHGFPPLSPTQHTLMSQRAHFEKCAILYSLFSHPYLFIHSVKMIKHEWIKHGIRVVLKKD